MNLESLPDEDPAITAAIHALADQLLAVVPDGTPPGTLLAALGRCVVGVVAELAGPDEFVQEVLGEWLAAVSHDAWVTRQEGR